MSIHELRRARLADASELATRAAASSTLRRGAQAALLTMALSLPQGLLALPIAVAQAGLGPGVLILIVVGALNTVTVAWTALLAQAPAALGLLIVVGLVLAEVGSFTQLIAVAGACAASVVSLVLPAWLTWARARPIAELGEQPLGRAVQPLLEVDRRLRAEPAEHTNSFHLYL